jgi:acyl-CoA hydrolase
VSDLALYQRKRTSAAEAVRLVRDGEQIVVPTGAGEPPALLTALSDARRDFRGVTVAQTAAAASLRLFRRRHAR